MDEYGHENEGLFARGERKYSDNRELVQEVEKLNHLNDLVTREITSRDEIMRALDEAAEKEESELNTGREGSNADGAPFVMADSFDTLISASGNKHKRGSVTFAFEASDPIAMHPHTHTHAHTHTHTHMHSLPLPDTISSYSPYVSGKAFVTFDTYTSASIARQSNHSYSECSMSVTHAPEPRDILWENITLSDKSLRRRHIVVETVCTLVIFLYVVPVSLVSLLVSKKALLSYSETLVNMCNVSSLMSQLVGMVQPICLVAIQQVLPPLFCALGKIEGRNSFSNVLGSAFSRYFLFQIVNVFLVTVIAGSLFDAASTIVDKPQKAFELLGRALPKQSAFFTNYILLKTFIGLGAELVRIVALLQAFGRRMFFPYDTARDRRGVRFGCRSIDEPSFFLYHKIFAQDMLVATVAIVFSIVAPLVLFPCALFFLLSRILWTYQLLFVYESAFETGGIFWPKVSTLLAFGFYD